MAVLNRPNPGKALDANTKQGAFVRYPVKTPLIKNGDDLVSILKDELKDSLQNEDILLVAESVVAISEGRAFKFNEIKPGFLARFLSRFVTRTPHGIGLGTPQTMQLAISEVGHFRILLAALVHVLTRPLGFKGNFYRVAGEKARGIDGPTENTIPPYNSYASLIPKDPAGFARRMEQALLPAKVKVVVIDANDIGVNILGEKDKDLVSLAKELSADNPLGQGSESTPALLCRRVA